MRVCDDCCDLRNDMQIPPPLFRLPTGSAVLTTEFEAELHAHRANSITQSNIRFVASKRLYSIWDVPVARLVTHVSSGKMPYVGCSADRRWLNS